MLSQITWYPQYLAQMGKKTDDVTVSDQDIVTLAVDDYLRVSRSCLNYCVSVNEAVREYRSKLGDVIRGSVYIRESIQGFQFPDSGSSLKFEAEQVLNRTCDQYQRQTSFLKRVQLGKKACDVIYFIYLVIAFICSMVDAVFSPHNIIKAIPALFGSLGLYFDRTISDTKAKIWVFSAIKITMLGLLLDLRRCEASHHKADGVIEAVNLELFETLVEEYDANGWFRFTYFYPQKEYYQAKAYILTKAEDVVKLA
ncbi:hypothetical protein Tco_0481789 [Tanacetum coccineum]